MYRNELLKGRMAELGKTVEGLAAETGLAVGTISAIRNGRANITLTSLRTIAEAVGFEVEIRFNLKPAPVAQAQPAVF